MITLILVVVTLLVIFLIGCILFGIKYNISMEGNSREKNKKDYQVGRRWENSYFMEHGCPFCGTNSFIEGPCGGMCVNITCSNCYAKFNSMGPFGVELLEKPKI